MKSNLMCASALALVGALIGGKVAAAAENPAPPTALNSGDVIVTATSVKTIKLKAPFQIATETRGQIDALNAASTADLLRYIPGVFTEPSGGESSSVFHVRGLPGGGTAVVSLQEDGLPYFTEHGEGSIVADVFVRDDLMTDRIEAVIGGTSPIYAHNAPGGIINYRTREGGDVREGAVRLTLEDIGLQRADAYVSGPLVGDWKFAAGGFYRISDGARPTNFSTDKGGQFRANVTGRIGNVDAKFQVDYLNDRNIFYVPIPLSNPLNASQSLSNLFDPLTGTVASNKIQTENFKFANGTTYGSSMERNLDNGRHPSFLQLGSRFGYNLDSNWRLEDFARYLTGSVHTDAIYSTSLPQSASTFLTGYLAPAQKAYGASVTKVGYYLADGQTSRTAFDPTTTDGLILQAQWRAQDTQLTDFQNEASITGKLQTPIGLNEPSARLYFSAYSFRQHLYSADFLFQMQSNPYPLDILALNSSGGIVGSVTQNGILRYGSANPIGGAVDSKEVAGIFADTWHVTSALSLDGELRYETTSQHGYRYNTSVQSLNDPTTLAASSVIGWNGTVTSKSEHLGGLAYSGGINYNLFNNLSFYARFSTGKLTPSYSNITTATTTRATTVRQYEAGFKYATHKLALYATLFKSSYANNTGSGQLVNPDGSLTNYSFTGGERTYGVSGEADWRPVQFFSIYANTTLQNDETYNVTDAKTGAALSQYAGKEVPKTPSYTVLVRPSFNGELGGVVWEVYGQGYAIGKRYVDAANQTALPSFVTYDAGVSLTHGRTTATLSGSNLTNKVALTEGNPRVDTLAGQGSPTAIYGRPLFGRVVKFSLTQKF